MNIQQKENQKDPGCVLYMFVLFIFAVLFFSFATCEGQTIQYKLVSDSSLRLIPDIKPNVVKSFEIKPNSDRLFLLEIDTAANIPLLAKLLVYPKYKLMIVDDSAIPGWQKWTNQKFYKQTFSAALTGATPAMTFTYIGDDLEIWGERYPSHGIVEITIDNLPPVEIDCYHATKEEKPFRTYTKKLPYASHTVTIKNTGKKNPSSTGNAIVIDFIVYRALNSQ